MTPEQRKQSVERTRAYRNDPKNNWAERSRATNRRSLLKKYDLTEESYEQLFLSQDSKCAICKSATPNSKTGWHIDHNHTTSKVRGILCHHCNLMIGQAQDSIERLQQGIRYLNKWLK